jgi:hypothetical protein
MLAFVEEEMIWYSELNEMNCFYLREFQFNWPDGSKYSIVISQLAQLPEILKGSGNM